MDPNQLRMREFLYSLIAISPGMNILDVGCGKGYDLFRMAGLVDGRSRLIGLDAMDGAIAEAQESYGKDNRLAFKRHDASRSIPFEDGSFDLVFSNNMLECVTDKQRLLREVHRALKPGGQVLFAHFDLDSQLIDGEDKALVRAITQAFNDWKQDWMTDIDPWMGRRLWRTFQESGLFDGRIETYVLTNTRFEPPYYGHRMIRDFEALASRGMIDAKDHERFIGDIERLHAADRFFYSITMYIYVGTTKAP